LYKDRDPPEEPPCGECRITFMEENWEAARIYHLVRRQVRTSAGSGEIIDLDYAALKAVMDVYGVTDQKSCFEKVSRTFHHFLTKKQGSA
jgi:hypothetical protein